MEDCVGRVGFYKLEHFFISIYMGIQADRDPYPAGLIDKNFRLY